MAMKTTLNIDDALFRAAKKAALERGVTFTSLIEGALRAALAPRGKRSKEPFRWIVVSDRDVPAVDVADRRALYDFLESAP